MREDQDNPAYFKPGLVIAAADVAIRHAQYDYRPGSASRPATGHGFQDALKDLVVYIDSIAKQHQERLLSPGIFLGSALVAAGIIAWPAVGFGVSLIVSMIGAAFIAAGRF